tara:strand:- start:6526 stop:6741 length:216 start_codon:yes stop_codon:yes gene_type:complete
MINNRKAYKIFMNLPAKNRKKLSVEYEIESVEKLFYDDFKWARRFHITHGGSFWNWLWMCHFKEKQKRRTL